MIQNCSSRYSEFTTGPLSSTGKEVPGASLPPLPQSRNPLFPIFKIYPNQRNWKNRNDLAPVGRPCVAFELGGLFFGGNKSRREQVSLDVQPVLCMRLMRGCYV